MSNVTKSSEALSYIKAISKDINKPDQHSSIVQGNINHREIDILEAIKVLLMHRKMMPSEFSMVTINLLAEEDFFTKNRLILPMTTSYVESKSETLPDKCKKDILEMCQFDKYLAWDRDIFKEIALQHIK